MKVLHVITGMQKAAGTSVFCAEVCNGLVAEGYDVTIAVVNPSSPDCYPLNPQIRLISIDSLFATTRSTRSAWFDIVHIHALWTPILHKVSVWAHRNNIPVVWSPHGMLTLWALNNKKWKKRLGWWLYQKQDLEKAKLLHATAQSEIEDIRRMGLKSRVVIAPLGIRIQPRDTPNTRKEKIMLFVSRVQRKKGLINLARAWANLKHESSTRSACSTWLNKWRVRIVGPDQEGHTQEVKKECERLGILNDWDFVGPKYGNELQREYDLADIFVLPSHSENFGSVVVEALAHGLPVITTKGTPWQELEAQKCGWWIDIGVAPLAKGLAEALALTDEKRHEMGERGHKLVEEKYTWDAVVTAMVKGYEDVFKPY